MRTLALLVTILSVAVHAADTRFVDRKVADVIDEYREAGEPFAYSTDLVGDELVVETEPSPGTPLQIVTDILRPHDLKIRVESGVYLVVREDGSGTIRLTVSSSVDNQVLPGARVQSEPSIPGMQRRGPGFIEYTDVAPGRYHITIEAEGFETQGRVIDVWPGEHYDVQILLDEAAPEIEEIGVSASRYEIARDISASSFMLDQRTIQNLPDIGEDPIRAIQRLPGAAASGASAKTHLRGGEEDEVGIMLNGQRLFDPFHIRDYQSMFSTIDSRAIEGVEVYTGGFPVQFGNRMSGVVLMESLDTLDSRHNEVGISVFNTSLLTAGSTSDQDWLFSARRGNLDLVINPDLGSPSYYDLFGKYAWDLSPTSRLSLNLLYADDSVEIILESDPEELERAVSDTSNAQFWLRLDNRWSEALTSQTVISGVAFDNHRRGVLNDEEKFIATLSDKRKVTQFGFRQDFFYTNSDDHHVQWGLALEYSDAEYDYANRVEYGGLQALYLGQPESSSLALTAAPKGSSYALYFSDRWRVADRSTVEWGLRWDDQTYTETSSDAQLSPRIAFLQQLGDVSEFRVSWGRYHQAQEIHELQIEDGITEFWPAQRADHLIVGFRTLFDDRYALRIEVFQKDVGDVRPRFENLYDPLGLMPEIQPDRVRLDPSSARTRGLEVTVDRSEGPYAWWATYVLSEASDRIDGRRELRSWDQTHAVQGGVSWSNEKWDVSVAANVHTGWPLTELYLIEGGVDEDGEIEYIAVPGPRNADRHATFASLDFRIARKWQLGNSSLMAFLEVSNATNRQNECCLDFDLEEDEETGEVEFDRSVEYWTPLLPAIGILWEF